MTSPLLDIVIPVFNEQEIIELLHQRVTAACLATKLDFCITYIDDGSSDGTPDWIVKHAINPLQNRNAADIAHPDQRVASVKLIQLSRNFGQPAAIQAGLESCQGDVVVLMDGDLQDPPELISALLLRWQQGDQIVIARRTARKETFLRGVAFQAFHGLFRYLADSKIPPHTGTFCLLDRAAVEAVCRLPESHRFFPGLRNWIGFRQSELFFERPRRAGGEPKQTFSRLTKYALDAVFGYSLKPLRLLTGTGAVVCMAAFGLACWFVFKRLVGWESASIGFTTLTCAVFGLGGFQLIGMGILGEYIGRIYDEVKERPPFIVAQKFQSNESIRESPTRKWGVVPRQAG